MRVELGVDHEQLGRLIDRIRSDPKAGRTVFRATSRWQQGYRGEATVRRRGGEHTVAMDEPASMGGSDTAPNMVETVLGAYGCCLISGFVLQAARGGIALEGVEIEVEGDIDVAAFFGLRDPEEVWPGCTAVRARVRLSVPGASEAELQELCDRVVRTSPVGSMLTRSVALTTELAGDPVGS
jgi:uncharacterized OsmC-like protein